MADTMLSVAFHQNVVEPRDASLRRLTPVELGLVGSLNNYISGSVVSRS